MRWVKRERVDMRVFDEWEHTIIDLIKTKTNTIRKKHKKRHRKQCT